MTTTTFDYLKEEFTDSAIFFDLFQDHLARLNTLDVIDCAELNDEQLYEYRVPKLGEGGACSLFNELDAEPYNLTKALGPICDESRWLVKRLKAIVASVVADTHVDWFGIYRWTRFANGEEALVKLAYFGSPSRAEFPITTEFAAMSNNVSVALNKHGRVLNDIPQYVANGGEYYTCDPKVKSEVCLPILTADRECLGIIDAEAFSTDFFNNDKQALLWASTVAIEEVFQHYQAKIANLELVDA